jgi:hypothetical protein
VGGDSGKGERLSLRKALAAAALSLCTPRLETIAIGSTSGLSKENLPIKSIRRFLRDPVRSSAHRETVIVCTIDIFMRIVARFQRDLLHAEDSSA